MSVSSKLGAFLLALSALGMLVALSGGEQHQIALPTSKLLTLPTPGRIGPVNGFPSTIAVDPTGRYEAILNDGYGTEQNRGYQSIAILDLRTNHLADFPEARLPVEAHQTYFLGLVFSSDGQHLYASMASLTDPTGARPQSTGNGIAVYGFLQGKVIPERFIKIAPQKVAEGKRVAAGLRRTDPHAAIPYPAGIAVTRQSGQPDSGDKLIVVNNLSDNVLALDPANGRVLNHFDLSAQELIPSGFPYTVVVARDGRRAWCSLWNLSRVAELNLSNGTVTRWIPLLEPDDPIAPGSHPTALLLSPDEKWLYVALSNIDRVAVVRTENAKLVRLLDTSVPAQKYAGTSPVALAQSADGQRLFVADSAIDAVAVFDTSKFSAGGPISAVALDRALGFIPTDWYPTALAVSGNDLLIASAKGQGTGPNNRPGKLDWERTYRKPAYVASLVVGSVALLKIPDTLARLGELSSRVAHDNLFASNPGTIRFAQGHSPIKHVIYVIKENRTYDQVFGDLKEGNGDPSLTLYGQDVTPNEHKLARQFGVLDNFYDSGAVSGDGHQWSTAATTTDYNEKTWPIAYRGNERNGDFGGEVEGELPLQDNEPDIDDPSTGYLWDNLARHGIRYRDYGESVRTVWCRPGKQPASSRKGSVQPVGGNCSPPAIYKGQLLPRNVGQPMGHEACGLGPFPRWNTLIPPKRFCVIIATPYILVSTPNTQTNFVQMNF